jgi:DMSO/TMAO reductase YedYZ molybdopterin-dependent catalytic subunit
VRVNGRIGMDDDLDPAAWRLRVHGPAGAPRLFTLADVQALPAVSMTTELKCIEGWSNVVHWTGARLADFARHYRFGTADSLPDYVRLETPDGGYYVGLDRASALHPQTLLCYAMNDAPLTPDHGAPLRLVIPVKYGIKSIKQIGVLRFTDVRPGDYWAERGYDWYAGH